MSSFYTILQLVCNSCYAIKIFTTPLIHLPFSISIHKDFLAQYPDFSDLQRFHYDDSTEDEYMYRSHGQPLTAYASFFSCLFIITIANSAFLWQGFNSLDFLQTYLAVS
jgi:amino acid permease